MPVAVSLPSLGSTGLDYFGGLAVVGLFALALIVWDAVLFLAKTRKPE